MLVEADEMGLFDWGVAECTDLSFRFRLSLGSPPSSGGRFVIALAISWRAVDVLDGSVAKLIRCTLDAQAEQPKLTNSSGDTFQAAFVASVGTSRKSYHHSKMRLT